MNRTSKPSQLKTLKGFRAVKKKKLYQEIMSQIQGLIKKEKLKVGDRLPPERDLAEIFNVSRHSVREAIRTLEQKNILKSLPGSGTFVVSRNGESIVDFLTEAVIQEKGKLAEIFEFRKMIEPQVAFLAAKNATIEEIAEMEKIIDQQKMGGTNIKNMIKLDETFHLTLARATKNGILQRIVEHINEIIRKCRDEGYQSELRWQKSTEGHSSILEEIKKRNPELALKLMTDHLNLIEEIVIAS
jgi:GntR family transcriptional repressor for pyruvate dehydrogenase complex